MQENQFGMANIGEEKDFNAVDFIRFMYSHIYVVLVLVFAIPSLVGIVTFFIKKPIYKSMSSINVTLSKKQSTLGFGGFNPWMADQEILTKMYYLEKFFYSETYQKALAEEVEGKTTYCQLERCERFRAVIRNYFDHTPDMNLLEKGANLLANLNLVVDDKKYSIEINGRSPNSEVSMAITNIATETLVGLNFKNLLNNSNKIKDFLEEQTGSIKFKLNQLEKQLVYLQEKNIYLGEVTAQQKMSESYFLKKGKLSELQNNYAMVDLYIKELKHEIGYIKKQIASNAPTYTYFNQLKQRFNLLKYQQFMRSKSRVPAQASRESQREITEFKSLLKNEKALTFDPWKYLEELSMELNKSKKLLYKHLSGIRAYEKSILDSQKEYRVLPDVLRKFSELNRNIHLTTELYSLLRKRYQETEIEEAGKSNDLVVMNYAEEPRRPTGMTIVAKYILSIIAALALGVFTLFIYYIVMPTFSGIEELEHFGLKIIGSFNAMKFSSKGILDEKKYPLVIKEFPNSYEANSMRYTRFKIETLLNSVKNEGLDDLSEITQRKAKVFSMVSVNQNEGKTFTSSNLAYALSVTDNKVLVIDIDFSKPEQNRYFPDAVEVPELEIMNSESRVNFRRKKVNRNLHVMDTEKIEENVCDYLESLSFKSFLEDLKQEYDIIVLDGPPMNGHLEPFLLSEYSDYVIFVTNQRKTIKDDFKRSLKLLRDTYQGEILGILNFTYDDLKGALAQRKTVA